MKFFILITALIASFASAADICRTSGSSCSGTRSCCTGIQENICCNLGATVSSILYTLPNTSRGQSFAQDGCSGTSTTFGNPTARTVCHIPANNAGRAARWLTGSSARVKRDEEESYLQKCAEPDTVIYERDGVEERVPIPEGQTADTVLEALCWNKAC